RDVEPGTIVLMTGKRVGLALVYGSAGLVGTVLVLGASRYRLIPFAVCAAVVINVRALRELTLILRLLRCIVRTGPVVQTERRCRNRLGHGAIERIGIGRSEVGGEIVCAGAVVAADRDRIPEHVDAAAIAIGITLNLGV